MLELTGMGSVLRGIGWLYWLLAIGAIFLALKKGKDRRAKITWAVVAITVFGFLPVKEIIEKAQRDAYAREAWAYFKKLCDEKSGEKIYKTYTGVKSVLVVKPLPPATEKDLFDQFWYGDPYSDDIGVEDRGERVAALLVGRREFIGKAYAQNGFDFVELQITREGNQAIQRISPLKYPPFIAKSETSKPESRFGISWEDISTADDRKFWVAASRLRILDRMDNSVVAERIGYQIENGFGSTAGERRPWQSSRGPNTTCPPITNRDHVDRWFILKAINPSDGDNHGK